MLPKRCGSIIINKFKGSGKTLAYGLPILHQLLSTSTQLPTDAHAEEEAREGGNAEDQIKRLRALILTPTRQLALQVAEHLLAVVKQTSLRVVTVIGGLSPQKQKRLLGRQPEIIVATPGRLWELISLVSTSRIHITLIHRQGHNY